MVSMANDSTAEPAVLKLEKGDNWGETVYNVLLDGHKVGWVRHAVNEYDSDKGLWVAYLHEEEALKANVVARESTRRDALMGLVSHLEIYCSGLITILKPVTVTFSNGDTFESLRETEVVIEPARLRALWNKLLNEKFPDLSPETAKHKENVR